MPDSKAMMDLLLDQLFLLLRRELDGVYVERQHQTTDHTPLVRRLVEQLRNNYEDPVTIENIAVQLGVSSRYLRRVFHDAFGMTINNFLSDLRIKKASSLLADASLSVLDVALQSGFSSSQYLAKFLRKRIGLTPTAFRAVLAEQAKEKVPPIVSGS